MGDRYDDYRPFDTSSAYELGPSQSQGSLEDQNNTSWQMTRSHSSFSQPQVQISQPQDAYGHRHSISRSLPRSSHRPAPPQGSAQNADTFASFLGGTYAAACSAPNTMPAPPGLSRWQADRQSDPYSMMRSNPQGAPPPVLAPFTGWRDRAPTHSELASEDLPPLTNGADSAYVSQVPRSVYSDQLQPERRGFRRMSSGVPLPSDDTTTILSSEKSGHSRRRISRSDSRRKFNVTKCEYCGKELKCLSDSKKHMLTHKKSFYCDVPDCPHRDPFGTINDLQRHRRSRHNLDDGGKWFRCAVSGCNRQDKMWPRFDNFKQHVFRVHKNVHHEDQQQIEEICKRSECSYEANPPSSPPEMPKEPMSMALAGIGEGPTPTIDPSAMQYPLSSDLLSPGTVPELAMQTTQHDLQGTASLHHPSPLKSASDRLSKAGPILASPSASTEYRGRGIAKRRRVSSPETGIAVLADAALNRDTSRNRLHPDRAAERGGASRSSSRLSDGRARIVEPENTSQLDQLLHQLKSHFGEAGLLETLKEMSSSAAASQRRKRHSPPSSVMAVSTAQQEGGAKCDFCSKVFARACDLKKHERRHLKPYGCTFPMCMKVFGSKNDWKRHENSQHFQLDMWRCQVPVPEGTTPDDKCGHFTWKAKKLKSHLRRVHGIPEAESTQQVASWRIGRSGHNRFWCGYCRDIVAVRAEIRGHAAWDERFNHIDAHVKEGMTIGDWLCIETRRLKGEPDGPVPTDAAQPSEPGTAAGPASNGEDSSSDDEPVAPPFLPPPSAAAGVAGSVVASQQPFVNFSAARGDPLVHCCQCGRGPYNTNVEDRCMMNDLCDHEFCGQCIM